MRTLSSLSEPAQRPALAFAGVGWIGLHRMQSIAARNTADIVSVSDSYRYGVSDRVRAT